MWKTNFLGEIFREIILHGVTNDQIHSKWRVGGGGRDEGCGRGEGGGRVGVGGGGVS